MGNPLSCFPCFPKRHGSYVFDPEAERLLNSAELNSPSYSGAGSFSHDGQDTNSRENDGTRRREINPYPNSDGITKAKGIKKDDTPSHSKFRVTGVEGSNNSCYMDSSLNSMFLFTNKFQSVLNSNQNKSSEVEKLREILQEEIVRPLSTSKSLKLDTGTMSRFRELLSKFNANYEGDEMDPEEFISTLFGNILKTPGFYLIEDDSEGSYVFQTYADMSEQRDEIDVQALLAYSFSESQIKLAYIPKPGFILKMPVTDGRHMFNKIFPNPEIDLRSVLKEEEGEFSTKMLLSAVICLSGHHFTSYVREGENRNSPWWYLDSFSSSGGELVPNMNKILEEHSSNDRHMSSLMSSCYMCFYLPVPVPKTSKSWTKKERNS